MFAQTEISLIDDYIDSEIERLGMPGMAVAIVDGDRTFYIKGFGVADSAGRAVTTKTLFYIGSISKSFTALAILQLVEAGKLNLDDSVQTYLPRFQLADKKNSLKITVRHLLNQISGISEKDGNRFWANQNDLEYVIHQLENIPLTHAVGQKYEYSNINYSIAGFLIEKVSGEAYGEYIKRHIFTPLAMYHSYSSREQALSNGLAEGHYYMFRRPKAGTGPLPPVYLPSGLLMSSVEDMAHYLIVHLNAGRYGKESILSPEGMSILHAPASKMNNKNFHYAMGWVVGVLENETVLFHNGDTRYFHSMALMVPDKKLGIVVLCNASGFEQITQLDAVTKNILRILKGDNSPAHVSLPISLKLVYWGILLMPILLTIGIVFMVLHDAGNLVSWWAIMFVALYLTVATLSVFKIPGVIPFSLTSMRVFYPELAYALICNALLGFGGIACVVSLMLQRNS